ncbi:MAG: 50S ribosomal protein L13, partial [Nitrospinota bacterium]
AGRRWLLVDAAGRPLGRVASRVAHLLRGKHKPTYTPHVDGGDHVVVVNASRVLLTGKKPQQKLYRRHSGYTGHLKEISAEHLRARHPERLIVLAVRGMLPKSILGRQMIRKLRVYGGPKHPHVAQRPEPIALD